MQLKNKQQNSLSKRFSLGDNEKRWVVTKIQMNHSLKLTTTTQILQHDSNGSLAQVGRALISGSESATSLTQRALDILDRDKNLNFVTFRDDQAALSEARRIDCEIRQDGRRGPLHGVPITVKDIIAVDGMPTSGATKARLPDLGGEATSVSRLKAAGAIVVAKTNLNEVAAGISGENSVTGDTLNPHDPRRQSGGSSSGSAVSVAVGATPVSLASDTAGSIRVPAALCGVVGFKPSLGLIPVDGVLPLCWSCDHVGPIATSVDDVRIVTAILAAQDELLVCNRDVLLQARLGIPRRFIEGWLSRDVRRAFEDLLSMLKDAEVTIVDIDIPELEFAFEVYAILRGVESAYVHRLELSSAPENFSPKLLERLLVGQGIEPAEYLEAQVARVRLRDAIQRSFSRQRLSGLILPTAPTVAPLLGSNEVDLERGMTDHRTAFVRLTIPFSLCGFPVLALPIGSVEGLPVSVQIVGGLGADSRVLDLAGGIERTLKAKFSSFGPENGASD
jgi:aspartyl-tRNA(Asn)/glutamyl-tRNA(Gln) amidotransferase subunit A